MTISIWRYSHLLLAMSSAIFLLLASITGAILALEPVTKEIEGFSNVKAADQKLVDVITKLKRNHDEVFELEVTAHNFVIASVITKSGNNETVYINPETGTTIAQVKEQHPIFQFATTLHRSLFLKNIGRFFVGLASLLLFIITITGTILLLKRLPNFPAFFKRTLSDSKAVLHHIILGKWFVIPIIIISITGVLLSCIRFNILSEEIIAPTSLQDKHTNSESFFENTVLNDVEKVIFPFSSDPEDYYIIKLKDSEVTLSQVTGKIVTTTKTTTTSKIATISANLHTGNGSVIWSIILFITSINILYFMYSGFSITLKRRRGTIKNKYKHSEVEYIILVGSENGSTFQFANALRKALSKQGEKVFVDQMNKFQHYKKMKHLIVMTATYGTGEAPTNAKRFKSLLNSIEINDHSTYTVLGFGSMAYPNYCAFAEEIDQLLLTKRPNKQAFPLTKINNKSVPAFITWSEHWSHAIAKKLTVDATDLKVPSPKTQQFEIINKTITAYSTEEPFILELKSVNNIQFKSGDLLAVFSNKNVSERLYSIAKTAKNTITLSIKRHQNGLCSNYLHQISVGQTINGYIIKNEKFHIKKTDKHVVCVSNGTGIAPFLGMISEASPNTTFHLYWGCKNQKSLMVYKNFLNKDNVKPRIAYSKEQESQKYVQDLVLEQQKHIVAMLAKKARIMVCGSLAMKEGFQKVMSEICSENELPSVTVLEKQERIVYDCY